MIIVEAVCVFIVAPLLIIFSVLYDYGIVGSIVLSILLALSLIYFVVKYRTIKKPRANVNIELIADHGFIEYIVGLDNKEKIPTNSIKKVIKIGQCYYIIRKHGNVSTSLMAEASLIKEGTIEEFEALFVGKIEVRTNN